MIDWTEAGELLMEEIVSRPNMMKVYNRVVSSKGAAGVDCMTTGQLKVYLQGEWPRFKEEMLSGTYNRTARVFGETRNLNEAVDKVQARTKLHGGVVGGENDLHD